MVLHRECDFWVKDQDFSVDKAIGRCLPMILGLRKLDDDHARIIALGAEVEALAAAGRPVQEICEKFHELTTFSLKHFSREEVQMESAGDPNIAAHRQEHDEIAGWLRHLESELSEARAGDATVDQAIGFLSEWIDRHLVEFDQPAMEHILRERASREVPVSL